MPAAHPTSPCSCPKQAASRASCHRSVAFINHVPSKLMLRVAYPQSVLLLVTVMHSLTCSTAAQRHFFGARVSFLGAQSTLFGRQPKSIQSDQLYQQSTTSVTPCNHRGPQASKPVMRMRRCTGSLYTSLHIVVPHLFPDHIYIYIYICIRV